MCVLYLTIWKRKTYVKTALTLFSTMLKSIMNLQRFIADIALICLTKKNAAIKNQLMYVSCSNWTKKNYTIIKAVQMRRFFVDYFKEFLYN